MPQSRILVNGQYLVCEGISGNLTDDNGLVTMVVPVTFPTWADAFNTNPQAVVTAIFSAFGLQGGLSLKSAPISQNELKQYTVTYTFMGVNQSWSFSQADEKATFALIPSDSESPIGAHPNFSALKTKYGWASDNPSDTEGPGHFTYHKAGSSTVISPLYGTTSWLTSGAEFHKRFVVRGSAVPASSWNDVNAIFANPPDLFRAFGLAAKENRKWIKLAPHLERNLGSATRVTERYRLTGPDPQNAIRDLYRMSGAL